MDNYSVKTKLLIADDDAIVCQVMDDILTQAGYTVDTTGNTDDLIRICLKNSYDLVILDYNMPPQDGITAIKEVQQQIDIGFLLITSEKNTQVEERSSKSGGLGFIYKDHLDPDSLVAHIRHAISVSKTIKYLSKTKSESKDIYTATGILSERYKLPEDIAYEVMRLQARSERIRITAIAKSLIIQNDEEFKQQKGTHNIYSIISKLVDH